MAPEKCIHPNRASGVVELDISRTPDRAVYSVEVAVGMCRECGHVEFYAKAHNALCDWLTKR